MDIGALGEEASLEAARELLIAISYLKPDKVPNPASAGNRNGVNGITYRNGVNGVTRAVAGNADRADEFRSKLISLSYLQSGETGLRKPNGLL